MIKKNNGDDMRIKTLSIALLIASGLFAGENGLYIGIDAGDAEARLVQQLV